MADSFLVPQISGATDFWWSGAARAGAKRKFGEKLILLAALISLVKLALQSWKSLKKLSIFSSTSSSALAKMGGGLCVTAPAKVRGGGVRYAAIERREEGLDMQQCAD